MFGHGLVDATTSPRPAARSACAKHHGGKRRQRAVVSVSAILWSGGACPGPAGPTVKRSI